MSKEVAPIALIAVVFIVWTLIEKWGNRQHPKAPPQDVVAPPAVPEDGWYPMPCGTRLELRDTGFFIVLDPMQPPYRMFQGFDPEGRMCATCSDLQQLKTHCGRLAQDRAAFAPRSYADWLPRP